jgi:hypothetical protein
MNINKLAVAICKLEGGKKSLSIGQVKEVMRCLADIMSLDDEVVKVFKGYVKRRGKKNETR